MSAINTPVPMTVSCNNEAAQMSVGMKQTTGTTSITDKEPYLFRASAAGSADVAVDKLIGGTVTWNQIVQNGNFASTSNWSASRGTMSAANNVLILTPSAQYGSITQSNVKYIVGHKYFVSVFVNPSVESAIRVYGGAAMVGETMICAANVWTNIARVVDCAQTASGLFIIQDNKPSDWGTVQIKNAMLHDLTQMFGSTVADHIYSLEQATKGTGVAWFKKLFPKNYYEYNAGELMSVKTSAHVMRDANENIIGNYPLDLNLTLRGIPKLDTNNNLYYDGDEYESNGTVTRNCAVRAYQSGDATNGTTMITDGTNTVYKLSTLTTEIAEPFMNPQKVDANGTEEYVDERDVPIPVGHETRYVTRTTSAVDTDAYPMTVTYGVEV